MADDASREDGLFNLTAIKQLIGMMARHDLSEIDLKQGEQRVRLRRGALVKARYSVPISENTTAVAAAAPPPTRSAPAAAAAAPTRTLYEIKSETPGTFYASSSPDAQPFVRVGARVKPGDVLCLIEAMKLFNEVTTDQSGVVAEISVQDKQAVEYGQVLFRLDTSA